MNNYNNTIRDICQAIFELYRYPTNKLRYKYPINLPRLVHFHECVGKFTCCNLTVYIQTFVGNFQIITAWDKEEITISISFTFQQFLFL
jgi:hypothetical protein